MLLHIKHNMGQQRKQYPCLPPITNGVTLGSELRLISVRSCTKQGSSRKAKVSETLDASTNLPRPTAHLLLCSCIMLMDFSF
jgi:hypothetical protein